MSAWQVWVTVGLLLGNAFFVGAEFAAMAVRRSSLEPLAEDGHRRAASTLAAMDHMGSVLAAAQLGITVCSVLLGAISEAALHHALVPVVQWAGLPEGVADATALVLALLLVVYLHVVIGEMIPKNLAIAGPERSALLLVPALYAFTRGLRPVIAVMEHVAKAVVRAFGVEPKDETTTQVSAAEMAHIVDESHREGLVEEDDYERLGAALEFSDKSAGQVGVPLGSLVVVTPRTTPADVERLVGKHGFSRYPAVGEGGELIGYLHIKDVLFAGAEARLEPVPAKRVRRLATVREADEIETVLATMQVSGAHLARVVADDGTTCGVAFLEDIVEELVGEVADATQRS